MTRLILMRHAKSDWGDVALEDHERPLNKRGRRSATALGVNTEVKIPRSAEVIFPTFGIW